MLLEGILVINCFLKIPNTLSCDVDLIKIKRITYFAKAPPMAILDCFLGVNGADLIIRVLSIHFKRNFNYPYRIFHFEYSFIEFVIVEVILT